MVMLQDQNAGQNNNMKIGNKSVERVEQFKYLGTSLMYQNHEEIKSRLTSGNACDHLVQSFLSSSLISKNVKIKIHRNVIFPGVLYGCETWSLTLRKERRLRVFNNWMWKRIFGPKRVKVTVSGEDYITRSSVLCTSHQILLG